MASGKSLKKEDTNSRVQSSYDEYMHAPTKSQYSTTRPRQMCTENGSHIRSLLLPQLIATLNSYACSLPPLANVNWSTFPECFCQPCKSTTGEMAPKEGSNLAVPLVGPVIICYKKVLKINFTDGCKSIKLPVDHSIPVQLKSPLSSYM